MCDDDGEGGGGLRGAQRYGMCSLDKGGGEGGTSGLKSITSHSQPGQECEAPSSMDYGSKQEGNVGWMSTGTSH